MSDYHSAEIVFEFKLWSVSVAVVIISPDLFLTKNNLINDTH